MASGKYSLCLSEVNCDLSVNKNVLFQLQLSPPTLGLLHQLVAFLQSGDSHSAMAHYTSMVSGTGFSEIAAFMPTIKVLIQLSVQMKVLA